MSNHSAPAPTMSAITRLRGARPATVTAPDEALNRLRGGVFLDLDTDGAWEDLSWDDLADGDAYAFVAHDVTL